MLAVQGNQRKTAGRVSPHFGGILPPLKRDTSCGFVETVAPAHLGDLTEALPPRNDDWVPNDYADRIKESPLLRAQPESLFRDWSKLNRTLKRLRNKPKTKR